MRYAHFAKICGKRSKVPNMLIPHIRIFLTCLNVAIFNTVWYILLSLVLVLNFSPLGKLAGRAIYFACVNFFFFLFFTMSKAISVSTGLIFTIFSPNGRYLRKFTWSCPVFPIPQGTLPWQPILWQNYLHPCTYCSVIPKRNGISPCKYVHL